jgi:hypothetical protein
MGLGTFNEDQINSVVLAMALPVLKKKVSSQPRGVVNWLFGSKQTHTKNAIKEVLDDPKNHILRNAVKNTKYWSNVGDFSLLARKIEKNV